MKLMVWNGARGGMRSVVEAYIRDGFIERENIRLIQAYGDTGFLLRQLILVRALVIFLWHLARYRVELVHCHAAMRGSFWRKGLFASLARFFRAPVILHLHGSEMKVFYSSQRAIVQRLIERQLRKANCVLVLSKSWKEFVENIAHGARVVVVPNYAKVPESTDVNRRGSKQVLFLGLIGPRKGTFDLIHAFLEVSKLHPDARLIIGGNGQIAEARALVSDLKLTDCVSVPGWIEGDSRAALLKDSAIFALPSYNEGLPISVLEAMAEELAVVTTDVGGLPELVTDGVNGLLIKSGDRLALADALDRLLRDAELRTRIGKAAKKTIETNYSDGVVLPLLHQIYEECKAMKLAFRVSQDASWNNLND